MDKQVNDCEKIDAPYIHTLIGPENKQGGLLICGINHGYSNEDERKDNAGIDRSDKYKSFFSDKEVNNYSFRNRIAASFELWGYALHSDKQVAGKFEKSLVQTNWLNTVYLGMSKNLTAGRHALMTTVTSLKSALCFDQN